MWHGMLQQNMKHKENRIHPTQKPIALYEWLLNRYAKPNDIILDTHVGSASSLIACYNTNHKFVGFELDEYYYKASKQRLEVNMQGTSNCLTSVQKDNMVLEKQGISTKGKQNDIASTILSGYERSNMTGFNADNAVIEKIGQISSDGSQCGTVISDNGISANLVAGTHGYANSHIATQYRIRKRTPRECGRLMGVSDEDIDKMAAVNSNTQLYKQFGNSIVVDVMCAMFKNLNINQGDTV